jgi:hypothetical protein
MVSQIVWWGVSTRERDVGHMSSNEFVLVDFWKRGETTIYWDSHWGFMTVLRVGPNSHGLWSISSITIELGRSQWYGHDGERRHRASWSGITEGGNLQWPLYALFVTSRPRFKIDLPITKLYCIQFSSYFQLFNPSLTKHQGAVSPTNWIFFFYPKEPLCN